MGYNELDYLRGGLKMKTILAGIGSFGLGWYQTLKTRYPHIQVVVVDSNPAMARLLTDPADRFYTDYVEALDREQPDFVLNLTPPAVHTRLNHLAFDRRIPVLCEKPIAEAYSESVEIVARAEREGIPFMIAENYRRLPVFRKARQLIEAGAVGTLSAVYVQFYKEAYFEKEYLLKMPEPLLVDVTVHHLDLLRYLTGQEGRRVFARSFNPRASRYPGNAALNFLLEMQDGAVVSYAGSLACQEAETIWAGEWRIQGTAGVLLAGESLRLVRGGAATIIDDLSDVDASGCLDEFLSALAQRREPESSGTDYLQTQKLVHYAQESIRQGCPVDIP